MSKIIEGLLHGDLVESEFILSKLCGEPGGKQVRTRTQSEPEPIAYGTSRPQTQDNARATGGRDDRRGQPWANTCSAPTPVSIYRVVKVPALRAILADESESGKIAGEQYRVARTKITQHPAKPQVILISSGVPGDGKTNTAIRLAAALSLNSQGDVLILDADLRRNSVSTRLDLNWSASLADVMCGGCELAEAIIRTDELPSLCVLQAGNLSKNPAEIFDSPEWTSLCKMLRERFSYVVIDSPPMAPFADYELLQAVADVVILVARPDHTSRRALADAITSVPSDKFVGMILNHVPRFFLFKPPHSEYYGYYSEKREKIDQNE
jgi:protein-tyrosine kinase